MALSLPLVFPVTVKPVLQDTLDVNQKTFRCWNYATLVRWRKALELRYTTWSDPDFSVLWQDTDYAINDVSVKPIANSTDLSNIAKTGVQVCRGEDIMYNHHCLLCSQPSVALCAKNGWSVNLRFCAR